MSNHESASTLFNFYALLIVYSSLAVTGIDSEQFLLPGQKLHLPVISLEVGIQRFLILSSVALLFSYLFWNIHLIRIQRSEIDSELQPWILSFYLNTDKGFLGSLEKGVAIAIRWWSAPIAITLLTVELIKFHDAVLSYFMVAFSLVTVVASIMMWRFSDSIANDQQESKLRISSSRILLSVSSAGVILYNLFFYIPASHQGVAMNFLGITSISNVINVNSKVISNPGANCNHRNYLVLDDRQLQGASFRRAVLENVSLVEVDFTGSNFAYASIKCSDLRKSVLNNVELINTDFFKSDLRGVKFRPKNMSAIFCHFDSADLENTDFQGVDLQEVSFKGARISKADFRGARNLTAEQLKEAQFIFKLNADSCILNELDSNRLASPDPNDRNRVFPFN